jgi:hypothetical protein
MSMEMNEPTTLPKKPNGCWWFSGCLLTVGSALLFCFFIAMIFYSEKKMDQNRAEYTASTKEYEEALRAYEADSAHLRAEYQRILAEIDAADQRNDSVLVAALEDSLLLYDEPMWEPRGHIGFNIGGAFFLVFALAMLIPMGIGLILLLYYRRRNRRWKRDVGLDSV